MAPPKTAQHGLSDICKMVSHLPKVIHQVQEDDPGKRTTDTFVEPLDDAARREEVARMLSGADITEEARAAADSLMSR